MNRRQFLKRAAVAAGGAALIPAVWGGGAYLKSAGSLPADGDPFADPDLPAAQGTPQGAPLLVLTHQQPAKPFSSYTLEILRAEGLNEFQSADLSDLTPELLARHDTVLLPEAALTAAQAGLLASFVEQGGALVAFRPDPLLAQALGLPPAGGTVEHGYLRAAGHPTAQGISPDFLKFHGLADRYPAQGVTPIAWLSDSASPAQEAPAVALVSHGQGSAVIWAFDLTRSVILSRQGNPALANVPGDIGQRTPNLFVDWIDVERLEIPYVDEQQRLLANILHTLAAPKRPLPRWWYFPGGSPSLLIATSDYHASAHQGVQELIDMVERYAGHLSIYYTPAASTHLRRTLKRMISSAGSLPLVGDRLLEGVLAPAPALVSRWRKSGHEFGLHPYVGEDSGAPGLAEGWQFYWQEFTGLGYGPVSPTARTHATLWTGWTETARVQASYGIRMNMDYYHWGPWLRNAAGEWKFGYLTGSGLAMKFVDEEGRLLDIYQQLTQLADEHIVDLDWVGVMDLPYAEGIPYTHALLERCVTHYPSAIACQFHADPFNVPGKPAENIRGFTESILESARELGIPIWSAEAWLEFVEERQAARFSNLDWSGGRLSLTVEGNAGTYDLPLLLPLEAAPGQPLAEVQVDGTPLQFTEKQVGGIGYGMVMVAPGARAVTAQYQTG